MAGSLSKFGESYQVAFGLSSTSDRAGGGDGENL